MVSKQYSVGSIQSQYAERPILFQTEMVKAILEGRKTQTRRKLKFVDPNMNFDDLGPCQVWDSFGVKAAAFFTKNSDSFAVGVSCKYGRIGDLLWVRETWGVTALDRELVKNEILYKADYSHPDQAKAALSTNEWKPSIHMPKSASRIWLMIEDIRVERLKDITEADAKAEGVEYIESENFFQKGWKNYERQDLDDPNFFNPILSFDSLWVSINGEGSLRLNPWVWVIQFRVLSTTGKPSDEVISSAVRDLSALCASAVNRKEDQNE